MLLSPHRSRPFLRMVRHKLRHVVESSSPPPAACGPHIDPADLPPVDMSTRSGWHREAFASPEMAAFRRALEIGDLDVRASVLDDLATFYDVTTDEARRRCLHWEEISLREWDEAGGNDDIDAGRIEFYRTTQSWAYDLMWWAYLQAEGHADPSNVITARFLQEWAPGRRHLDFGSGVGVTSQLFAATGWNSTMADLSSTLLDFARFRIERRGGRATTIDLLHEGLPAGAYDAVTAVDTLAHVPDVYDAARRLHAALGPGGLVIANFDVRSEAPETVWHLQDDERRAVYDLRRAGFVPVATLGYELVAYRKAAPSGPRATLRRFGAWLTLVSPARTAFVAVVRAAWSARERLRRSGRDER